jgi:hypothetical protein
MLAIIAISTWTRAFRGMNGRFKAVFLGSSAILGHLLASSSGFSQELPASYQETLSALQRTIQIQQQKLAEYERRLAAIEGARAKQDKILAEQNEALAWQSQQLQLWDRTFRSGEFGRYTSDAAVQNAVYGIDLRYGGVAQAEPSEPAPRPPRPVPPRPPALAPAPPAPPEEEVRPEPERIREELLIEAGAVLLPKGTLQLEPSIDYTHVSTDRVAIAGFTIFEAIIIGTIRVDELDRDIITAALDGRYGVTDRLQVEGRVPYVYRNDTEILGVGTIQEQELTIDGYDIGDVEFGVSYQVLKQRGYIPGTVLRLRGRVPTGNSAFDIDTQLVEIAGREQARLSEAPTGSGFLAVEPGYTVIWRVDPVAFFSGGSYTFNLERDQGEFGTVNPGDSIEVFAGLNIAVSDVIGLNFSFVNQITMDTEVEGVTQVGTEANDARLAVGSSIGLTPNMAVLVSASAGLTDESPDFSFIVSLPMNFSLF